jgi:homoserine dehydrogenase
MSKSIGLALIGCGVVGSGVIRILASSGDRFLARYGTRFEIRHVVVRDLSKQRDVPAGAKMHSDVDAAIDDPAVHVVVELMGGTTRAGDAMARALRLGKPVVTANKALLALKGPELFALARKQHACIGFEASCAGGVPIIDAMLRGLAANRINMLVGIVNGTCNFILTKMSRERLTYTDALRGAQEVGFAEADPTLDVSGRDAAQKLSILATLAFGQKLDESHVLTEGIDTLDARDIGFARELGYAIKLLAIGRREGDAVSLRVCPTLVHAGNVMAEVAGGFNAVGVWGDALGHALFYGRGAGQMPTASAVVADLISVATGQTARMFEQLDVFPDTASTPSVLPVESIKSRYYLRLTAQDKPGVLARVTEILGRLGISISAVIQREGDETSLVPIVITTHQAAEGAVRSALAEIDTLEAVRARTVCLRILDEPDEFGR